jgi:hypothetical protein
MENIQRFISKSIDIVNTGYDQDVNPENSPFADAWKDLKAGKVAVAVFNFSSKLKDIDPVLFAMMIQKNINDVNEMLNTNDINKIAHAVIQIITSFYEMTKYLSMLEKHEQDFKKKIDECDLLITHCDTIKVDSDILTQFKEMVAVLKNYKNMNASSSKFTSSTYSSEIISTIDLIEEYINPTIEELRQSIGIIVSSV